jgi:predicted DNA-binding transcriptional regulator AlpA
MSAIDGGKTDAEVLDAEAVGRLLGCSASHVRRMVTRGQLPPPVALGALRRWPTATIRAFLTEQKPDQHGLVARVGPATQTRG